MHPSCFARLIRSELSPYPSLNRKLLASTPSAATRARKPPADDDSLCARSSSSASAVVATERTESCAPEATSWTTDVVSAPARHSTF